MLEKIIYYLLPILNVLGSAYIIYGTRLFYLSNHFGHLITTLLTANVLIFIVYYMFLMKYSLLLITITSKVLPTVLLALISFFITKEKRVSTLNLIGLISIVVGIILLIHF